MLGKARKRVINDEFKKIELTAINCFYYLSTYYDLSFNKNTKLKLTKKKEKNILLRLLRKSATYFA